jgi:hypothetical protein
LLATKPLCTASINNKHDIAAIIVFLQIGFIPHSHTRVLRSSFRLPRQSRPSRTVYDDIDQFPTLDKIESLGETNTPNKKKLSTKGVRYLVTGLTTSPLKYNHILNVTDIPGVK